MAVTEEAALDEQAEKPWHLRGNWAPVSDEVTATDLPVRGEIPPGLDGHYLRAGMNPRSGYSDHWFFGNGMIHAVELRDGRALSYRNRYVRTPYYEQDMNLFDGLADPRNAPANTHVLRHNGRVLVTSEMYLPWEITTDLETIDAVDFDGRVRASTAHMKVCPVTGELVFFDYAVIAEPWLTYHRADPSGRIVSSEVIEIPRPVMMHDFNITENHVVFMDLPLTFDLAKGGVHWAPEHGARLGVMPRDGGNDDVRWHDVEPGYVFHPVNAYEDGDRIVIDVARFPEVMSSGMNDIAGHYPVLWRWTIDTVAGTVTEEQRDDRYADFCRVDDRRVGLPTRFGYLLELVDNPATQELGSEVYKYDLETTGCAVHQLGEGVHGGEPVFVPRTPDAEEDDGWVVLIAHDERHGESRFVVIDAQDFESPPVAEVTLPQRVPYGAHGNWFPRAG